MKKAEENNMRKENKVMIEPQVFTLSADETRSAPSLKINLREKKFAQLAIIAES